MTEYNWRASSLASRVRKRMMRNLDDGFSLNQARRYAYLYHAAYPGMPILTPGQVLDGILEQLAFESRF